MSKSHYAKPWYKRLWHNLFHTWLPWEVHYPIPDSKVRYCSDCEVYELELVFNLLRGQDWQEREK